PSEYRVHGQLFYRRFAGDLLRGYRLAVCRLDRCMCGGHNLQCLCVGRTSSVGKAEDSLEYFLNCFTKKSVNCIMGFATKKTKRWELRQLTWTFLSIVMFIPFPVHLFPFVMIAQARKSKIRSWYITGLALLLAEAGLFASFVYFFGAMSQGMLLTLGGYVASYIVGNGLLLNRAKPYLQRLELAEVRPLAWIPTASSRNRLQLLPQATLDTPQLFIERLMYWRKAINNVAIHKNIDKIIHLFHLLEERDKMEAEKFLVRHSTIVN